MESFHTWSVFLWIQLTKIILNIANSPIRKFDKNNYIMKEKLLPKKIKILFKTKKKFQKGKTIEI